MKYTFKQFQAQFPDDAACLLAIMNIQYGGTNIVCPGCGVQAQFHAMEKRRGFACQECGHHIYPCAGTIFHKSSTKLTHWFFAMYLMTSTRHGVAAKELERQIGCTYKTAWRMAHELRKLMASADGHGQGPLSGHVEVDETLIGGRNTGEGQANYMANKTTLLGMMERDGRIVAGPVPSRRQYVLERAIKRNVEKGTTISTDEWKGYNNLEPMGYVHGTVNHSDDEWVNGIHHTNSIEGHWSQLKRAIRGTHVHVSRKHLWKYVSEFSYRRNMRHSHRTMFDRLFCAISLPRLADV
ncbi:MAG: IS1595 family transposase [Alphaproteobacteria bacterium]|nr:IS1595 family transposase [Alphaproteobacteria bacterium]MBL6937297.1 IS1595 family transposase [Alphaproteobacteria bacterium]MBL7096141.1 IS1595 family transposase [Alphaproteobacteria bacterium]